MSFSLLLQPGCQGLTAWKNPNLMPASSRDAGPGASTRDPDVGRSPYGQLPAPPQPSADAGIKDSILSPSLDAGTVPSSIEALDIATLSPLAALSLLTTSVKSMISDESKRPPTPPPSSPTTPRAAGFDKGERGSSVSANQDGTFDLPIRTARYHKEVPSHHKTPLGSPETHAHEEKSASATVPPQPPQLSLDGTETGSTLSEYDYQCLVMARTFHCKVPPPIPLNAYLRRIHRYCPMSTAVYLAAAHYIQRVTHGLWEPTKTKSQSKSELGEGGNDDDHEEPDEVSPTYVQITPRSVHRLVLAALRIATKALEDHNWQHSRFAGVGGVPEASLTRLEIALCHLLEFRLFISRDALCEAARWMLSNEV